MKFLQLLMLQGAIVAQQLAVNIGHTVKRAGGQKISAQVTSAKPFYCAISLATLKLKSSLLLLNRLLLVSGRK